MLCQMYVYIDGQVKSHFQGQGPCQKSKIISRSKANFMSNCHYKGQRSLLGRGHLKAKGQFQDWLSSRHIINFIAMEIT